MENRSDEHSTARRNQPLGRVARVAAWITRHRGRVLLAWLVVLVAAVALFKGAGSDFSNSLTLPGTQSQAAVNALQRDFPRQAGDQDQIVFVTSHASITAPATRARIASALARVAQLPHVVSVVSPYSTAGAHQISVRSHRGVCDRDLRRAGAVASGRGDQPRDLDRRGRARPSLQVALGGQAIEHAEKPSLGSATAIGLLAAIIILLITFGSFVAMGLPIITALLGLGVGISLAGLGSHIIQIPDFATAARRDDRPRGRDRLRAVHRHPLPGELTARRHRRRRGHRRDGHRRTRRLVRRRDRDPGAARATACSASACSPASRSLPR